MAIDARDKLNDNFHKWMTYYYVANGAILLAITSLYRESSSNKGLLALSLIGLVICILWNQSCKGYYYWSKSWISLIIALERRLTKDKTHLGVYSIFSKRTADYDDDLWHPLKGANISTPKLTMIFSTLTIVGWMIYSAYEFLILYSHLTLSTKILILGLGFAIVLLIYYVLLPTLVPSRSEDSHKLV